MEIQIREMLELQDKLNLGTNWEHWKLGLTNKNKIINWKRCMYMELAEAIDSVSWKHWKNIDGWIDYENFKVELIDVWHFLMSELMIHLENDEIIKIVLEKKDIEITTKLPKEWKQEDSSMIDNILEPYEDLMILSLARLNSTDYLTDLIEAFFICLNSAWVSFNDLYKLYIWKNVLNKFRQDNGYKEWTYKKIWWTVEDNVVMQQIVEKHIWFDTIYKKLEDKYNTIK